MKSFLQKLPPRLVKAFFMQVTGLPLQRMVKCAKVFVKKFFPENQSTQASPNEVFPVDAFQEAASRVVANHPEIALQYGTTEGYLPLRALIAERSARYGLKVGPENISITSGTLI